MTAISRYRQPSDLPGRIPVFPLRGAILLPRVTLPLNVFEPRYLMMIDACLRGDRLVGIVQPKADVESPEGKAVELKPIGCVGRLTSYQETDDNRYGIVLTGISRFRLVEEQETLSPGDRVLLMGVGSGLNTAMMELAW